MFNSDQKLWKQSQHGKSNLTDKIKRSFFQAAVVSILLYGCTTWTLTKRLEKKLDGNYTRMLRAILNRSWQQHSTRRQLYDHLPPITKTIEARRTRHAGHCWRSKDEIVSDVLLWTPAYGQSKAGRPARAFIEPKAMNDRETWRERVRDIRASRTWWWWWWWWWWWLIINIGEILQFFSIFHIVRISFYFLLLFIFFLLFSKFDLSFSKLSFLFFFLHNNIQKAWHYTNIKF